jgi:hypothetical protein
MVPCITIILGANLVREKQCIFGKDCILLEIFEAAIRGVLERLQIVKEFPSPFLPLKIVSISAIVPVTVFWPVYVLGARLIPIQADPLPKFIVEMNQQRPLHVIVHVAKVAFLHGQILWFGHLLRR